MKTLKFFVLTALFTLTAFVSTAQVYADYEERNGYVYAVLTNRGSTTVSVVYRCVNYQLGQWRDGSVVLKPDYETCIGPNIGWTWQYGEELLYQVSGYQYNISFQGTNGPATPPNSGSDGYIYQPGESYRYKGYTYKVYKDKWGHKYIYDKKDGWIKIAN